MSKKKKHTIKSYIVTIVAVSISMLYVMNPIHEQISDVWHNILHAMEAPTYLLSHEENNANEVHHFHEHNLSINNHKHEVIDFISSIFEASDNNDSSDDSFTLEIKIDKHLISEYVFFQNIALISIHQNFDGLIKKPFQGYKDTEYIPPRLFS